MATAATMAGLSIIEPLLEAPDTALRIAQDRNLFVTGVLLEVISALASAGIAIALYSILGRCVKGLAVAYLGLRLLEAGLSLLAATSLLLLLTPIDASIAITLHHWAFVMVLLVFSIGTLIFYPVLFHFRLVPRILSLWGLAGGVMLLVSCLLILFGWIDMESGTDTLLSLPIWINEMALALWLIFRGIDFETAGIRTKET